MWSPLSSDDEPNCGNHKKKWARTMTNKLIFNCSQKREGKWGGMPTGGSQRLFTEMVEIEMGIRRKPFEEFIKFGQLTRE